MKAYYQAITERELLKLRRVSSRIWKGAQIPVESTKVDNFWFGYDAFDPTKEVLPVFGERIGVETANTADKILLYSPNYIRTLLNQILHENRFTQMLSDGTRNINNYVQGKPATVILDMAAEDLLANRVHLLLPKLPTPTFSYGFRALYRYRYCLPGMTTLQEWVDHWNITD